MSENFRLEINPTQVLLKVRGLEEGGRVQKTVDSEVLRYCDPYVPFDTGALKTSGITATVIGSGEVVYNTPYARRQYYENSGKSGGLRGKQWFERMKADRKEDILRAAKAEAGGIT